MIKRHLTAVIVFSLSVFGSAFSQNDAIEKQVKEFELFKQSLLKLDAHSSDSARTILEMKIERIEPQVHNSELSSLDLFKVYSRCVSFTNSTNTQIFPGRKVLQDYYKRQQSFPFDLVMYGRKLYVSNKSVQE